MFRRFTRNLGIKAFCLLAAVFLWVYVAAGQSTIGKFPSSLKIKTINVSSGLVAIYDTKVVEIKIMADPTVWKKLSAESFSAYLDLSGLSAGTHEVSLNIVSSVPEVQIVEKSPDKVIVSLEPITTKEVNVNKRVLGNAAEGLAAGNIELVPDKVVARGAKSIIDDLGEATAAITLNGETDNFQKTIPVSAYDETGELVSGLDFAPAEVTANVSIIKASNNKTVGVRVKTTGSPKAGYFVSSIFVTPSVVDITGPRTILPDVNFVETAAVDITNASTDIEKEIALDIGDGLTLQAGISAKVKVKISFAASDISREVSVPVTYDNLDAALKIINVSPAQVKVIVNGSTQLLGDLKSDDIILRLDLKNKTVGAFSFDISPDSFKFPDGITVLSALPSVVTVTVDKK